MHDHRNIFLQSLKEITAKEVFDAAKAGDAAALEITEEFGAYLGQASASMNICMIKLCC